MTRPHATLRFRAPLVAATALLLAACGGGAAPETAPTPSSGASGSAGAAAQPAAVWPTRTLEHVDLWLHGFAMLVDDTAQVPIFKRGYRAELQAARGAANVTTQLDAERDRLRQRLATSPQLALGAQFLALSFPSWADLKGAASAFIQANGDPQRAGDQRTAQAIAFFANTFRSAAEREWLRLFVNALDDESTRFHHRWWLDAQRDRSPALAAADSVWQRVARPALQRFLTNTQQRDGQLLLSVALGGEGRTQTTGTRSGNVVTVGFPARAADAADVTYAAVHELVGGVAGSVVGDNVTPAQQREGAADRLVSSAQVRGGLLLLQRLAPTLAAGYARFYLREAGRPASGDPVAALVAAFPLPQAIVDGLNRQLDVTLGGI
ncbi:hypothetical protein [Roseisolibacter sp. H3M3-2]|uniref:hypothetical protein n=1 Tax=Roseisolibacter sp. H3M3-2 TaxID=3031323 RepID=UPI0023DC455D|nr:hypothetical protein [Roseisolibacter sp. H3M3-2]MDF1501656.1 hypothetical protein [Roseisolibacter sp. H3M3-2]